MNNTCVYADLDTNNVAGRLVHIVHKPTS